MTEYQHLGFAHVDYMLCPSCGGRGDFDDEKSTELVVYLSCGCGNVGQRPRNDDSKPTMWTRGAGKQQELGEAVVTGDVRVTIGRELPCEASQNGVVINLVGPYKSVLTHLSRELRLLLKETLDDTSQMGI